ncbi:MAG: PAS domain S-box protein [bacterium]
MKKKNLFKRKGVVEIIIFLLLCGLGVVYINYTANRFVNVKVDKVLQIARTIGATLPKEDLTALSATISDTAKVEYKLIKKSLKDIIGVNSSARFAYLYTERNGKIFIFADSEEENSKDYSPPGQQYTEADKAYSQVFIRQKEKVTSPVTERWGKWISVLIPIKDPSTSKVLAIFGIDFDTKLWNKFILYEVIESRMLLFLLLITFLVFFYTIAKNKLLKKEIIEHKETVEALGKSEKRLHDITSILADWIWEVDVNGIYTYSSRCSDDFLGQSRGDIIGKTASDFISPDEAKRVAVIFSEIMANKGPIHNLENWNISKNGEKICLLTNGLPILDEEGNLKGYFGVDIDITESRLLENELRESEGKYRALIANLPSGVVVHSSDTSILISNAMAESILGLTADQMQGKTAMDPSWYFLNEDGSPMPHEEYPVNRVLSTGKGFWNLVIGRPIQNQGGFVWALCNAFPVLGIDGNIEQVVVSFNDITKRRLAEDALRLSEGKLRSIIDKTTDFIAITDANGFITYASPNSELFFLYTSEEIRGHNFMEFADETIAIEAIGVFKGMLEKDLKSKSNWLMKRRDGSTFIGELTGSNFQYGGMNGTLVVIRDITESKRMADALQISEEKYRLIAENSSDTIAVMDLDLNWTYVSPSVEKIWGYTVEEALLQKLDQILTPDSIQKIKELIAKVLPDELSGTSKISYYPPIQLEQYHKNGSTIWVELSYSLLRDKNNIPIGILTATRDISDRKHLMDELNQQKELLQSVFDHIPVMITYYNETKKLEMINHEVIEKLGWSYEDWNNESILSKCYPDPDTFNAVLDFMINKPIGWKDFLTTTKWGTVINTSWTNISLPNGVSIGIGQDVTERRRAEVELLASKIYLNKIINSVASPIFVKDDKFQFCLVNEALCSLLGLPQEELIGKTGLEHFPDDQNEVFLTNDKEVLKTGIENISEEFLTDGVGKVRTIITIKTLYTDLDGNKFIVGIINDITEQKEIQEELTKAKLKAEESDRLKSAFLSNMSHEIRTPMNGILGFAGLLKEVNLTGEEQQDYIEMMEKSGARMLNIITDIVNISKIESGQIEVLFSDTNINDQIEFIYNLCKPEAEQKQLRIIYGKTLPANEAIINTDREKIYAILTNLVKNAIKFTKTGTIEFGYNKIGEFIEFYVKDTGIGINQEQLEFVFERFRQGSESLNRNYEGAGLGLSISKAYVQILGGNIWVESEVGVGSTFYFTIPYVISEVEKFEIENLVSIYDLFHQINSLKILIAEDDDTSDLLITMVLKNVSAEILHAKTGIEAIEICRNNPDISLIMMDIKMPVMDGYEATRQIRLFNEDVIIIAQTAFGLTGDRNKAIAAGCNEYLTKPIDKIKLMELMNKHFSKSV